MIKKFAKSIPRKCDLTGPLILPHRPQPLKAEEVLFSPMASGMVGREVVGRVWNNDLVRALSQKL